ncbi:lactate permease LctP family transporter [Olivibacter ginsenosidimutans]|uniref:L-lactate permease n=1 Tax=Olivibacter ginsenosidimutans TaxID=1176537 RepID=A0ABP9ADH6_9SPHI
MICSVSTNDNAWDLVHVGAATLPILAIFWALVFAKWKGHWASLFALGIASIVAYSVFHIPVQAITFSSIRGMLYGLFPVSWIVINTLFLFNLSVESGQFNIIKQHIAAITPDPRLQVLLVAFSFGAFLEGTAGYGAPVAITAAMLVGLGFQPLQAAGICLIANTAPVAFGAVGIPITVLADISGLPEMAISQTVGRTLPFLSLMMPMYLIVLLAGWKRMIEILPALIISGGSFALLQGFSANFIGPTLPDIIAGLGSLLALWGYLRIRNASAAKKQAQGTVLRAFSPFLLLTVFIILWGIPIVKQMLDQWAQVRINIGSKAMIIPYLSTPGTAILLASLCSIPLTGLSFRRVISIYGITLKQLRYALLTIATIMGFAYLLNDSGITFTLAIAMANTGVLYPLFAPILGWLGVFITGSDTSSNALFGKLQYQTAQRIGLNPLTMVAANASGGVLGKMISPQSIAVAAAGSGLTGKESNLLRYTLKHSFILLGIICIIVLLQAYLLESIIPDTSQIQDLIKIHHKPYATQQEASRAMFG